MTAASINPAACPWCSGLVDHLREPVAMTSEGPMHRLCALEQEVERLRRALDDSARAESLARTGEHQTALPRAALPRRIGREKRGAR